MLAANIYNTILESQRVSRDKKLRLENDLRNPGLRPSLSVRFYSQVRAHIIVPQDQINLKCDRPCL